MDLSILIISYNTKDYLRVCIQSIYKSKTRLRYEIIVVDNNSLDGSVAMILAEFPNIKLIQNSYNYGFSTAMNQGFRISDGRYVMSFNPDAELFENTIERALAYMDANPHVGKVGLATFESGSVILPHFQFNKLEIPHLMKILGLYKPKMAKGVESFQVDWIFGTGLVIRRSVLPSDYIYPENTFLFWEEFWLSEHIRKQGFEMHVLPDVLIIHHASVTFKKNPDRVLWARLLSCTHEWRVRKEYYGWLNATLNTTVFALDNFMIYLLVKIKNLFRPSDPVRETELLDRKARFLAGAKILFSSQKQLGLVDSAARQFFNGGISPPYPPVSR